MFSWFFFAKKNFHLSPRAKRQKCCVQKFVEWLYFVWSQELAVRCIQRNVRAFLMVRDWPWWRLLVRVTPLLNVHRTEEQLKAANDELQMLKGKLDKIETERATLKAENEKLEAKVSVLFWSYRANLWWIMSRMDAGIFTQHPTVRAISYDPQFKKRFLFNRENGWFLSVRNITDVIFCKFWVIYCVNVSMKYGWNINRMSAER